MLNRFLGEVTVRRTPRDGWFVYTCETLPGLYVAHRDDKVAYDDLPEAIRLLIKLNDHIDCVVSHAVPYAQFVQQFRLSEQGIDEGPAQDALQQRTDDLMSEYPNMIRFVLQSDGPRQAR